MWINHSRENTRFIPRGPEFDPRLFQSNQMRLMSYLYDLTMLLLRPCYIHVMLKKTALRSNQVLSMLTTSMHFCSRYSLHLCHVQGFEYKYIGTLLDSISSDTHFCFNHDTVSMNPQHSEFLLPLVLFQGQHALYEAEQRSPLWWYERTTKTEYKMTQTLPDAPLAFN